MEMKSEMIGGRKHSWQESGSGQPVVLIHGIPTSPALWRHVTPLLDARALCWTMQGYGALMGAAQDTDISVGAQADYLADFIRHLDIGPVVLAGHDLGGGVAQIVAVRHPELVSGLFLTNAISYDSWPIPSVKAVAATGGLVKHLPDGGLREFLRNFLKGGHDNDVLAAEALDAHWPHYEAGGGAESFVAQVRSLDVKDTTSIQDALPGLNIPARLAWGDGDQFQKVEYGERLSRDLNAPLRRIDGAKHFTPEDHPKIIAEEITALLGEVGSSNPERPKGIA